MGDRHIAMRQTLLWVIALLASWGIGLLVAAWIVPGVSLSVPGFIVAVLAFAVMQGTLSLPILKLPREYCVAAPWGHRLGIDDRRVDPRVNIDARSHY